ncbi:hypothetical protein K435DRAFT_852186 [Dendrothele bispora CBS 962.96]|uniref:Uncharacterized protein n=1 Tax=Dendrothele bispora (strain CBS 962.96) TaxID=1314807 RepID=A0A4S8MK17_DENBC|nr:hypothetical protein K435DRAFT_852186 [Dendrothele bispora CBS 962.96]
MRKIGLTSYRDLPFRLPAGSTILCDTYGYDVTDKNDLIIRTALKALNQFSCSTSPPYYAVEYFLHSSTSLPGSLALTYLKQLAVHSIRNIVEAMAQMSFDFTKNDITEGNALHSFFSSLLEYYPIDEAIIKHGQPRVYTHSGADNMSSLLVLDDAVALAFGLQMQQSTPGFP